MSEIVQAQTNFLKTKEESFSLESVLMGAIKNPEAFNPEHLNKVFSFCEKLEERKNKKAFFEALCGFQGECPLIVKKKKVDFKSKSGNRTNYDYAPLDEIVFQIKPLLKKYGLSFSFEQEEVNGGKDVLVTCIIRHSKGHFERSSITIPKLHDDMRMNVLQRAKSALTYAKRAVLESSLGLVVSGEDDDAQRLSDTFVTDEEVTLLKVKIKESGSKEEDVLNFGKVNSLQELTRDKFISIKKVLDKKINNTRRAK